MELKIKLEGDSLDYLANELGERLIPLISKCIESHFSNEFKDTKQLKKYLSPTEFSRLGNISKPIIYKKMNDGSLTFYQRKGSSKKYLKSEDIDKIFERVDVSPKIDKYEEFEREFRLSLKRGKLLQSLIKEFQETNNNQSISGLSQWIRKQGHKKEIFNGVVIPDFE